MFDLFNADPAVCEWIQYLYSFIYKYSRREMSIDRYPSERRPFIRRMIFHCVFDFVCSTASAKPNTIHSSCRSKNVHTQSTYVNANTP